MAKKYKIKITKAYHIAIEDKDGYEVATDLTFLDYTQAKKEAQKLLEEVERKVETIDSLIDWDKRLEKAEEKYRKSIDKLYPLGSFFFHYEYDPNDLFRYSSWEQVNDGVWKRVK